MNYYIADLHFGHVNALTFDNRPFTDIKAHDKYIIDKWNNKITSDDNVYILGDISWHNSNVTLEIFENLKGNKILIKGNHDDKVLKNRKVMECFDDISDYKEIKDNDRFLVLCHYPIPCFNKHYYNAYHLYGHVHSSFEWNMMENIKRQMIELYDKPCNMYNIGVMMNYMNYEPKTLDEIIKEYKRCL